MDSSAIATACTKWMLSKFRGSQCADSQEMKPQAADGEVTEVCKDGEMMVGAEIWPREERPNRKVAKAGLVRNLPMWRRCVQAAQLLKASQAFGLLKLFLPALLYVPV